VLGDGWQISEILAGDAAQQAAAQAAALGT
jgi:hypothetical protein